jgi:hypothetical protein
MGSNPRRTTEVIPMRGRKPRPFSLLSADLPTLYQFAHSRTLAFATVQRARIVLAIADGQCIQDVAVLHQCDPATVWRLCRRYEQGGLYRLLDDLPRCGRPQRISPPPARSDRRVGLSGTHR